MDLHIVLCTIMEVDKGVSVRREVRGMPEF